MQEIIKAQGGNPEVNSEALPLGKHTFDIIAEKDGVLKMIDLHDINAVCRKLGCPVVDQAGLYLYKKT